MLNTISLFAAGVSKTLQSVILEANTDTLEVLPESTVPPIDEIGSVQDTVSWVTNAITWAKNYAVDVLLPLGIKILIAVLIFFVGKAVLKKLVSFLDKSLHKGSMEEGTIHFLKSIARGAGMVLLVFLIAYYLNFGIGAIVAMLGSAGLALGLALQGSLANFAGGIMLLITKPFRVGDYICALGNEGVVSKMDIVYTTLVTADNRKIVMPNGSLANTNIVNVTNEPTRRIDISIGVDYDSDIRHVKSVLLKIAKENQAILQDQDTVVFVNNFDASAIDMGMRVWVKTEDYWTTKWELQETIKVVFDQENISIPYERVDVNMVSSEDEQVKLNK